MENPLQQFFLEFDSLLNRKGDMKIREYAEKLETLVKSLSYTPLPQLADDFIRENEEKYRTIFDNSPIGIFRSDPQGNLIEINLALAKMYGYESPGEALQAISNVVTDYCINASGQAQYFKNTIKNNSIAFQENLFVRKDGTGFLGKVLVRPIKKKNGDILFLEGIVEDVTERRKAEEALKESQIRYKHITESITDYIVKVFVEDGKAVESVHGAASVSVTGYSPEEFSADQHLWYRMIYPDDCKMVFDKISSILKGNECESFEHRIFHKNGSIHWIKNNCVLFKDYNGELYEYDAVISDITSQKAAEEALKESEHKYRLLFNKLSLGFAFHQMIYDDSGKPKDYRYIEINPSFEEFLGIKKEKVVGRTVLEIIPNLESFWIETYGKVAMSGEPVKFVNFSEALKRYYEVVAYSPKKDFFAVLFNDITERKVAEKALTESEERYRKLVEFSPDAICVHTNGELVFMNDAGYKLVAASNPYDVIGKPVLDFVHPDYHSVVLKRSKSILEKNISVPVLQEKFIKLDGTAIDVEVVATPIVYNNKPSVQVIIRDISDRKKAQEALQASEERFTLAMEATNDGIFEWNSFTGESYFSPRNYKMLGYETNEFAPTHENWFGLIHPDDVAQVVNQFQDYIVGNSPYYEAIFRLRTKSGDYKWILERGIIIKKYEENNALRVIGVHTDIDERRRFEESLKKERDFNLLISYTSPVGILTFNRDGYIVFANARVENIYGLTKEELIQKKYNDPVWSVSDLEGKSLLEENLPFNIVRKTLKSVFGFQQAVKWPNGKCIIISVNASPILSEDKTFNGMVATVEDITKRIKSEKELIKAKEKAEESDRLKTAFLANMSHEIRTPMNGIIGFAALLEKHDLPVEKRQQYINIIQNSTAQLLTIITDILDISKIESGQVDIFIRQINLNSIIDELYLQFEVEKKLKNKEHLKLKIHKGLSDDNCNTMMDKSRLTQIFTNLIGNALKFTLKGYIEFGYKVHDKENLLFYVKDTGIGIPSDKQAIIFERFVQADSSTTRRFGGTGLGLAICNGLIDLLKGFMWVESLENHGSTFYFLLPYNPVLVEKPDQQQDNSSKELTYNWSKYTILIVEDVDYNTYLIKEMLLNTKVKILCAGNATLAMQMCKDCSDIDIVLMDIQLPDLNGYEATKEIKKLKPQLTIIAQTAYGLVGDREKSLAAGCDDYISKPIIKSVFLKMLNNYFSRLKGKKEVK